jgi:hypothetical protein
MKNYKALNVCMPEANQIRPNLEALAIHRKNSGSLAHF